MLKSLSQLRSHLEQFTEDKLEFYQTLDIISSQIERCEISLKFQEYNGTIHNRRKWDNIITIIPGKLAKLLGSPKPETIDLSPESMAQINSILNFLYNYYHASRRRSHIIFPYEIFFLLKSESWDIVVKALKILSEFSTRNKLNPALIDDDMIEWLQNIALGDNLKNYTKISFLDMLTKSEEQMFQYYSENKEDDMPTIRRINLSNLVGNTESSHALAQKIFQTAGIPENLFPSLWCKVRIAKISPDNKLDRYKMAFSSLLAYKIIHIFQQLSYNTFLELPYSLLYSPNCYM